MTDISKRVITNEHDVGGSVIWPRGHGNSPSWHCLSGCALASLIFFPCPTEKLVKHESHETNPLGISGHLRMYSREQQNHIKDRQQ